MKDCKTIVEYMAGLPEEVRADFSSLWREIRELVPEGEEAIRYGMPTIRFRGKNLVHCAVMKEHFGFYPAASGVRAFENEIAGKYGYSKGAIRFPFGKRLPMPLIRRIVRFRLSEESSLSRSPLKSHSQKK